MVLVLRISFAGIGFMRMRKLIIYKECLRGMKYIPRSMQSVLRDEATVLENEIRKIVAKIIEVEPEKIGLDTHFVEDLGADSMTALEIMAALEKKFNINIPEEDLHL